jgi:hypothetical protein
MNSPSLIPPFTKPLRKEAMFTPWNVFTNASKACVKSSLVYMLDLLYRAHRGRRRLIGAQSFSLHENLLRLAVP